MKDEGRKLMEVSTSHPLNIILKTEVEFETYMFDRGILHTRYINVKVEHYLLSMFSPPKIR
jgi:hypothetical protein